MHGGMMEGSVGGGAWATPQASAPANSQANPQASPRASTRKSVVQSTRSRMPDDGELQELWSELDSYLSRHVRDRHAREDLVQETMMRLLRGIAGLRERGALRAWARRIAYHLAVDRRRSPSFELSSFDERQEERRGLQAPPDHERDVVERRRCWLDALVAALRDLGAQDRALIVGHYFVGWPQVQIAQRLGLSLANVKVRMYRARARMRCRLPNPEEYSAFLWARSRYDFGGQGQRSPSAKMRLRA